MFLNFFFFPRMHVNLSWRTVFSTCKDSCKSIGLCDSRALGRDASILHFSENLASLEVSPKWSQFNQFIKHIHAAWSQSLFPVTSAVTMQFQFSTKPLGHPRCALHGCHSNSFPVSSTFTLGVLFMELPEFFIGTHTSVLAAVTPWKLALSQLSLPIHYVICTGVFFETTCLKHQIAAYLGVLKNTQHINIYDFEREIVILFLFLFSFFNLKAMLNKKKKAYKSCLHALSLPME